MHKHAKRRHPRQVVANHRGIEVLTVGWMLMVFTTLACELVAALAYLYVIEFDRQAGGVQLLSSLLTFAACLIGILSLLVCPVVLRTRRVPPPPAIVVFSVIVGFAPLIAVMFASIR
ncbi:MAG TPA: hypothetical protein VIK18_00435 [Pirellulales bacterium]